MATMVVGQFIENPKNGAKAITGWTFDGSRLSIDDLKNLAKENGTYSIDETLEKPDYNETGTRYHD